MGPFSTKPLPGKDSGGAEIVPLKARDAERRTEDARSAGSCACRPRRPAGRPLRIREDHEAQTKFDRSLLVLRNDVDRGSERSETSDDRGVADDDRPHAL